MPTINANVDDIIIARSEKSTPFSSNKIDSTANPVIKLITANEPKIIKKFLSYQVFKFILNIFNFIKFNLLFNKVKLIKKFLIFFSKQLKFEKNIQ